MRINNKCALLFVVMAFSAGSVFAANGFAVAQSSVKVWGFDADKPGSIPEGFTVAAGDWRVVADASAPSKPNVLAQTARNSGSTFNLILTDEMTSEKVDISVKMKAVGGKEDQGGGLVWRARNSENYYIVRYNPLEDNYRVYKVERGHRTQLQNADIQHTEGWHTLRVTMEGDHILCYYDGQRFLDLRDSTFQGAGKIGLWTKADAQSHFDDLTVVVK